MRIVSMVPSWTEALIACGADVVGRTRFCIHPAERIGGIPAVGGTKDIKWDKVQSCAPDLIILDQEENPRRFHDEALCETLVTHIRSIEDVAPALRQMSARFTDERAVSLRLSELAQRWQRVCAAPPQAWTSDAKMPGVMSWVVAPDTPIAQVAYVIWREPWMCVGRETFIASVLGRIGFSDLWSPDSDSRYPEFTIEDVPSGALLLFSSEPYPFHRKVDFLRELNRPAAIVDGEKFSWFGLRSLVFLEEVLGLEA